MHYVLYEVVVEARFAVEMAKVFSDFVVFVCHQAVYGFVSQNIFCFTCIWLDRQIFKNKISCILVILPSRALILLFLIQKIHI